MKFIHACLPSIYDYVFVYVGLIFRNEIITLHIKLEQIIYFCIITFKLFKIHNKWSRPVKQIHLTLTTGWTDRLVYSFKNLGNAVEMRSKVHYHLLNEVGVDYLEFEQVITVLIPLTRRLHFQACCKLFLSRPDYRCFNIPFAEMTNNGNLLQCQIVNLLSDAVHWNESFIRVRRVQ